MITLFPIAVWNNSTRGANGTNWPFFCTARKSHPFAAAIMAQEIYESRFKAVRLLAIVTALAIIVALAAYAYGRVPTAIDIGGVLLFSIVIGMLVTGLYPPWQRELELRGQGVEVEVRHEFYDTPLTVGLSDSAKQLGGYGQFKGMTYDELYEAIRKRRKIQAADWVKSNKALVTRAHKEATNGAPITHSH